MEKHHLFPLNAYIIVLSSSGNLSDMLFKHLPLFCPFNAMMLDLRICEGDPAFMKQPSGRTLPSERAALRRAAAAAVTSVSGWLLHAYLLFPRRS